MNHLTSDGKYFTPRGDDRVFNLTHYVNTQSTHSNRIRNLVRGSDTSLYFSGKEYEGLHPNTNPLIKDNHLFDEDNHKIPIRD